MRVSCGDRKLAPVPDFPGDGHHQRGPRTLDLRHRGALQRRPCRDDAVAAKPGTGAMC